MTARISDTATFIGALDSDVQTPAMPTDDWIMPEVNKPEQRADTDFFPDLADAESSENFPIATRPVVSAGIRKAALRPLPPDRQTRLLQQWECVILTVKDDVVECEMYDLTAPSSPVEYAEVYLEEFNHFDRGLLQQGGVFYWSIGRETSRFGQVRRFSEIRVRRLPKLSKHRRQELSLEAQKLSEELGFRS